MGVKIVTGYTGTNHITSADDQARNYAAFGASSALWDTNVNVPVFGTQFEATMQDATTLRIGYGEGFLQGVHFRIPYGEYVDLTIDPGQQGVDRHDVVVAHYTKAASTGVESVSLEVVKGTPGGNVPEIPVGSIYAGDTDVREIMYIVHLNGVSVTQIENELNVLPSLYTVNNRNDIQDTQIDNLNDKVGATSINGTITGLLGSTRITSVANTITAAIVALKGLIDAAVNRIAANEGKISQMGTTAVGYLASTTSIPDSTATALTGCSVTLSAGVWIIIGKVTYQGGTAGSYRQARLGTTATGQEYGIVQFEAASNNRSAMVAAIATETGSRTFYLSTQHGNGSATTVSGGRWSTFIEAVRIA